jgi:hypothetical protein
MTGCEVRKGEFFLEVIFKLFLIIKYIFLEAFISFLRYKIQKLKKFGGYFFGIFKNFKNKDWKSSKKVLQNF